MPARSCAPKTPATVAMVAATMSLPRLRAIDLCGGAGGWACAARGLPIEIVYAVDRWDDAIATYQLNHPNTECAQADLSDGATIDDITRRFAGIDLVLGAIPCEWISSYRSLRPASATEIADGRRLTDAVIGLISTLQPRWWVIEDVVPLIGELPILTPYQVIDARGYSGQKRKRVFVGDFPKPAPGRDQRTMRDYRRDGPYRISRRAMRRVPCRNRGFSLNHCYGIEYNRKTNTVINNGSRHDGDLVIIDEAIAGGKRQIEWQECAALQGFPTDYVFVGSPGTVSKLIGQAIQIDTGRAILQAIVANEEATPPCKSTNPQSQIQAH